MSPCTLGLYWCVGAILATCLSWHNIGFAGKAPVSKKLSHGCCFSFWMYFIYIHILHSSRTILAHIVSQKATRLTRNINWSHRLTYKANPQDEKLVEKRVKILIKKQKSGTDQGRVQHFHFCSWHMSNLQAQSHETHAPMQFTQCSECCKVEKEKTDDFMAAKFCNTSLIWGWLFVTAVMLWSLSTKLFYLLSLISSFRVLEISPWVGEMSTGNGYDHY